MVSKSTASLSSVVALEDELDYLYLRHLLVANLIKALEVYAMAPPKGSPESDDATAPA